MRFIILICSLFILGACAPNSVNIDKDLLTLSERVIPKSYKLQTPSNTPLGKSIKITPILFLTPDHLYQKENALYHNNKELKIISRKFDQDILFFEGITTNENPVEINDMPPKIGEVIYWLHDNETATGKVLALSAEFEINNRVIKNLISFEGVAMPGDSGSPVFDVSGKLYGMIIGADREEGITYAVRGDRVLELLPPKE